MAAGVTRLLALVDESLAELPDSLAEVDAVSHQGQACVSSTITRSRPTRRQPRAYQDAVTAVARLDDAQCRGVPERWRISRYSNVSHGIASVRPTIQETATWGCFRVDFQLLRAPRR